VLLPELQPMNVVAMTNGHKSGTKWCLNEQISWVRRRLEIILLGAGWSSKILQLHIRRLPAAAGRASVL
jgi:hypothetical protein